MGACCQRQLNEKNVERQIIISTSHQSTPSLSQPEKDDKIIDKLQQLEDQQQGRSPSLKSLHDEINYIKDEFHIEADNLEIGEISGDIDQVDDMCISEMSQTEIRGTQILKNQCSTEGQVQSPSLVRSADIESQGHHNNIPIVNFELARQNNKRKGFTLAFIRENEKIFIYQYYKGFPAVGPQL